MKTMIGAALAFAFLGSAATAQMAADKMAPGDMKKVDHCKAMKHDAMMANATCQKMMKL